MGTLCLWERVWYLLRGGFAKGSRRFHCGGVAGRRGDGAVVQVHYRFLRSIRLVFAPEFSLKTIRGIGVAVPPSYLEAWARRFPGIVRLGANADLFLGRCPGLRVFADHVLLRFERTSMSDFVTSSTATSAPIPLADRAPTAVVQLQCPACRQGPCRLFPPAEPSCLACGYVFSQWHGIYNALPPDRELTFRQLVHEYESVRAKEVLGSDRADYYLALPFNDLTGRNAGQWSIRARTFRFIEKNLLPRIESRRPRGCDVLDVGAGNGWLSYRLAPRR